MHNVVDMKVVESGGHLRQIRDYVFLFTPSVKYILLQVAEGTLW